MFEAYHTYNGSIRINGRWEDIILEVGQQYPIKDFHQHNGAITDDFKSKLYFIPDLLSGSDYSGGTLNRSNYNAFMKRFKNTEGVYSLFGGYDSYSVAIRVDIYESNEEIKKTIDALEDYPVIDEENLSELENEIENKSLKVYISDNKNSIYRHVEREGDIEDIEEIIDTLPDEDYIEQIAWEGISALNLNWSHEQNSAYLSNILQLIQYIEDRLLIDHCKDFPLLINREWACGDTKQKYKDKFSIPQEAL